MKFEFVYFRPECWAHASAEIFISAILKELDKLKYLNIMLTGGLSAKNIYKSAVMLEDFNQIKNCDFYLSDDRYVEKNSGSSNYDMIFSEFNKSKIFENNCTLHKLFNRGMEYGPSISQYEKLLPAKFDISLLTVGDDGHIASIFPGNEYMERWDLVKTLAVESNPKDNYRRVSLSKSFICSSKKIYLLAPGSKKKFLEHEDLNLSFTKNFFKDHEGKITCFMTA